MASTKQLGPSPVIKLYDTDGTVLASGTVETYDTGTSNTKNSYTSSAGAGSATSFTLDANGEAVRYFDTDIAYKLIIKDSSGSTVRTIDPYTPIPAPFELDNDLDVNGFDIISSSAGDIAITPNSTGDIILDGLKWPQADGTTGQVLKTDGSAQLSWTTISTDIVNDTTPQLGGDLDTNSYNIQFDDAHGIFDDSNNEIILFQKTASAVNYIDVTNSATGNSPSMVAAGSDTNISLALAAKGSGVVKISGLSYPTADGTSGQFLTTNGSGVLSFASSTATQAEMEAGTATGTYVTPALVNFAPGSAKGYIVLDTAAANQDSLNVSSVVDNGTGDYTINWDTDFSSANYAVSAGIQCTNDTVIKVITMAAGSTRYETFDASSGAATETGVTLSYIVVLGDQ
jgi:hypothetical protein